MKNMRLIRIFKSRIPSLLAALFLAALLFPGAAASAQTVSPFPPESRMVFGQVIEKSDDETFLVIRSGSREPVTVNVDPGTSYTVHTIPIASINVVLNLLEFMLGSMTIPSGGELAGLFAGMGLLPRPGAYSDIEAGDLVSVRMRDGSRAAAVNIIKYSGTGKVTGEIMEITASSITIMPVSGSAVTAGWNGSTRFVLSGITGLQSGQTATMLYDTKTSLAVVVTVGEEGGSG